MALRNISEYNRDQLSSFRALAQAVEELAAGELNALRRTFEPYLEFRGELDEFFRVYFASTCRERCFDNSLSACCGFESIFTFFADQAITYLESDPEEREALMDALTGPNTSQRCVYLVESGCLWRVRPISCAMFFCEQAKEEVFVKHPEAKAAWRVLQVKEKQFTRPTQPVIFDEIEAYFREKGVESPHMYFHKSPGLLRLKAKSGLLR